MILGWALHNNPKQNLIDLFTKPADFKYGTYFRKVTRAAGLVQYVTVEVEKKLNELDPQRHYRFYFQSIHLAWPSRELRDEALAAKQREERLLAEQLKAQQQLVSFPEVSSSEEEEEDNSSVKSDTTSSQQTKSSIHTQPTIAQQIIDKLPLGAALKNMQQQQNVVIVEDEDKSKKSGIVEQDELDKQTNEKLIQKQKLDEQLQEELKVGNTIAKQIFDTFGKILSDQKNYLIK